MAPESTAQNAKPPIARLSTDSATYSRAEMTGNWINRRFSLEYSQKDSLYVLTWCQWDARKTFPGMDYD